jgi:ribulose-5-phosphate 4-epimerase/fuculose-1-phosphate aldolase
MVEEYKYLSNKYGTFLNWFQAGGGNISVKKTNELYIKQSGTAVCDGKYIICDNNKLLTYLATTQDNYKDYMISSSSGIPSIEVWFHAFTKKYTIHMHPVEISELICTTKYNLIHDKMAYYSDNYLIIDYMKPGKELAQEIWGKYNNESIIFLINHGIIFTSDSLEDLHNYIIKILQPCEDIFKLQEIVSNNLLWKSSNINQFISGIINVYIPDFAIYLGHEIVNGNLIDINNYIEKYNNHPKLIIYSNILYIYAETKKKYYDIEEMLTTYVVFNKIAQTKLNNEDIDILMNWDREKYRQNL